MSDAVTEQDGPQPMGVVEQLARDDVERKKFLRMVGRGVGAAGAASAFGAFLAACGSSSSNSNSNAGGGASTGGASTTSTSGAAASGGGGDLAIANYALTLEYLETEFYKKVVASGLFSSSKYVSVIKKFGQEEQQHVDALIGLIKQKGGTPAAKPKGKFPLKDATSVLKLAATVENLGANAYLGQAGNIKDKDVLAAALSIHTVEARHAATLNTVLKMPISPDGAFAKPADMQTVLAAVKPFIAA